MKLKNEQDIIALIRNDTWMMDILQTAASLQLPDWWVCAGFVRSKVWDVLHEFEERTPLPDVDVIYFDATNIDERTEKQLEEKLQNINSTIPWSVKNQARMHLLNDLPPYVSSTDAMSKFPETVTALGAKLDKSGTVILSAPNGIEDLLALKVKPAPHIKTKELIHLYEERLRKKDWKATWPNITLFHVNI